MTLDTNVTRVHSLTGRVTTHCDTCVTAGHAPSLLTPLRPQVPDLLDLLGVRDDQEVSPAGVVNLPLPDEPPQRPVHCGRHVPRLPDAGEVGPELLEDLGHVGCRPSHLELKQDPANGITQRNSGSLENGDYLLTSFKTFSKCLKRIIFVTCRRPTVQSFVSKAKLKTLQRYVSFKT